MAATASCPITRRSHTARESTCVVIVHTNGIESVWAVVKRMHMGTYHWMSVKHLHRYIRELAGRHNLRPLEPLERIAAGGSS